MRKRTVQRSITTPEERQRLRQRRQARKNRKKLLPLAFAAALVAASAATVHVALADVSATVADASEKAAQPISTPSVLEPEVPEGFDAETYVSYRKEQAVERIQEILKETRLIAHAGGEYREGSTVTTYTNSQEAFDQNYHRGLRAFEIDLQLTSDGDLACTHDWTTKGGTALSASQWTWDGPTTMTGSQLNGMLVSDLFREIATKTDTVLFTDTKAFEYDWAKKVQIYSRLVDAFSEVDPDWLLNVAPYVYSEDDYEAAMDAYDWAYVVYAAYANGDTTEEILDFVLTHDNARAICLEKNDKRLTDELIELCHENDVAVFTYTTNSESEAAKLFKRDVDVLISDSLAPEDL